MKVVVNRCFGGFGLSTEAIKQLVLKNADCIKKCTPQHYYEGDKVKDQKWKDSWEKDLKEYVDIGDGFLAHKYDFNIFKDGFLYDLKSNYDNEIRANKYLVEVVEELGDRSFGKFAKLEIVEIPDDVNLFEIDES